MTEKTEPVSQISDLLPCPFCGSPADAEGWSSIDRKGPACTNSECDGAADSAEAWNRRAHPSSSIEGVKVKKLEWAHMPGEEGKRYEGWRSATIIGEYFIDKVKGKFKWFTRAGGNDHTVNSLDEAKDAAQADYGTRILSALDLSPKPLEITDAMIDRALARSRGKDLNTMTNSVAMREILTAALQGEGK